MICKKQNGQKINRGGLESVFAPLFSFWKTENMSCDLFSHLVFFIGSLKPIFEFVLC